MAHNCGGFFSRREITIVKTKLQYNLFPLWYAGGLLFVFLILETKTAACMYEVRNKYFVMLIITLLCCFKIEKLVKCVMLQVGLRNYLFCSTLVHQVNTRQICIFKIVISYWQKSLCLEHKGVTVTFFMLWYQYSCPHSSILKQSKVFSRVLSDLQMVSHKEWSPPDPVQYLSTPWNTSQTC